MPSPRIRYLAVAYLLATAQNQLRSLVHDTRTMPVPDKPFESLLRTTIDQLDEFLARATRDFDGSLQGGLGDAILAIAEDAPIVWRSLTRTLAETRAQLADAYRDLDRDKVDPKQDAYAGAADPTAPDASATMSYVRDDTRR